MMTPFICRGCQQPIMERYLMKVLDKSWHVQCVKCSECQCLLNETCFSRESKLYCRNDFFKRYGTKCAGCNIGLCPEDLVRRAMNKVYHVQCFTCSVCKKQLSSGEQLYLLQGERFLCEHCFQVTTQTLSSKTPSVQAAGTMQKQDTPKQSSSETTSQTPVHHYHPSSSPASSDGKRTKTRTSINPQQLDVLMQAYNREQRPSKQTREDLMARTGLDMKVIQVWFQNRRSKEKRDASYRDALKEETSSHSTPVATPPMMQQGVSNGSSVAPTAADITVTPNDSATGNV